MSELDRILDTVMKDKEESIKQAVSEEDLEELITSLREQKKKKNLL